MYDQFWSFITDIRRMLAISAYVSLAILVAVYVFIIQRRRFGNIPIWTSMTIGALLMVLLQVITVESAFAAINLDIILFLFGMFSIVSALEKSGVLGLIAIKMVSRTKGNPSYLLLVFIVGLGILSAFLVNDTIAILGVPLAIYVMRSIKPIPIVLLIGLAFGITIGSVMTPIGNPQNLLIAIQGGIQLPFITFLTILAIPTIINLLLTYFILKLYFRKELLQMRYNLMMMNLPWQIKKRSDDDNTDSQIVKNNNMSTAITNPTLAKISVIVLLAVISGFIIVEALRFLGIIIADRGFSISVITITGATMLYTISKERTELIKSIDYSVLIFFAAMFVFTAGLWTSGLISEILSYFPSPVPSGSIASNNAIIAFISISFSQLLGNVPFVALYNLVMIDNGFAGDDDVYEWMMLAAASTIAGNLTILGAASNIIIIGTTESRGFKSFGYIEFLKIGSIVTLVNVVIYYLFILLISYI
jgi:Na+/H+ antiporter NhaD/arsenite permease-like protein